MTDRNSNESKQWTATQIVNRSGFPFQFRVKREIERFAQQHGLRVVGEIPWHDSAAASTGYADIVLSSPYFRAIFECKRATGARWVFQVPEASPKNATRVRAYWSDARDGEADLLDIDDVEMTPASPEAEFCYCADVANQKGMIEPIASTVVGTARAVGELENALLSQRLLKGASPAPASFFHLPILVTNAQLLLCTFDPDSVPLGTGEIDPAQSTTSPVDVVRFRKSLLLDPLKQFDWLETLSDVKAASELTVFVVQAEKLGVFLDQLNLIDPGGKCPWDRARSAIQPDSKHEVVG